ncbi:LOW protein: M-phase inducer phosphatase-like protein [Rhynchospora pubera]|uniref:LOW protein: M-phase inducer phosphatase-like protein n=1 Tax=Rhynchospora pubera TaxID=906938 RepID=A0AAV8E2M0_9POAL|nr:LOW protein: M-phase inducer phosphatase-like protein [Rhynchospora pubera]
MAGILQYLDFNQGTAAAPRKLPYLHRRNTDGLEAPRNSIEFTSELCQSNSVVHVDIPYSCHTRHCSKSNFHTNNTPMKKLIEEEISNKSNEGSRRPSVVARLMGMDLLPKETNKEPIQQRDLIEASTSTSNNRSNTRRELFPSKRHSREHPQEEALQKFKKEFEAWQASKLLERSRSLELENFSKQKFVQSLPLHEAKKGKEGWYEEKVPCSKPESHLIHLPPGVRSLSPTRIVILKPCPEMAFGMEESTISSPEIIRRENNMVDFLEEVKNKLKLEIEGKSKKEKTDPKHIARSIANQIRETVVQDLNGTLTRSESARSYQNNADGLQENKDTKSLLSEKIRSVLKREIEAAVPFRSTKPSYEIKRRGRKVKNREEAKTTARSDRKSTTQSDTKSSEEGEASPRNLVRSFSAPVSGTAFVKLLTEEPHASARTRSQIKHEAGCEHERTSRKDASAPNSRVGNLTHNLGLRRWLFRKRIQSADEETMKGFSPVQTFVTTPSVVMNSGFVQENFTEVPPSPASVCNSPRDEMCRGGYPSPVSPLDASFTEEHFAMLATKEMSPISPNPSLLRELADLNKPDEPKSEEISTAYEITTPESHEKSYVKSILVTAGLYKIQMLDPDFSRWDTLSKPIPNWVFDKLEEITSTEPAEMRPAVSHKMLFDLTNEVLIKILSLKRWYIGVPYGTRLLNELWRRMERLVQPREVVSCSLDSLIYGDLRESSWCDVLSQEIDELETEIGLDIADELIDELFWDALVNIGELTHK